MTDAKIKHITTPLTAETIKDLHAGDVVRITGPVYTARDAAHKRMTEAMAEGRPLRLTLRGRLFITLALRLPNRAKLLAVPGQPPAGAWINIRRR